MNVNFDTGGMHPALIILMLGFVSAIAIWTLLQPERVYFLVRRWRYTNPDEVQLSDLWLLNMRIAAIGWLLLVAFVGFLGLSSWLQDREEAEASARCHELRGQLQEFLDGEHATAATMEAFSDQRGLALERRDRQTTRFDTGESYEFTEFMIAIDADLDLVARSDSPTPHCDRGLFG